MAGIFISDLRRKIERVRYAFDWRNNEQFADAIGRKPSTLSDYFKERGSYGEDCVPPDALSDMSKLLVRALAGTKTVEKARDLWCGPLAGFEAALEAAKRSSFGQLLSSGCRAKILTFERHSRPHTLRMIDFMEDDPVDAKTQVGDTFHFDCAGPAGHWLVLLIESNVTQLGWPRGDGQGQFAADGPMRVPGAERGWKFSELGLHRFIAFAIEAEAPPSLFGLDKPLLKLPDRALDDFAAELKDPTRVQSWTLDVFDVAVLDKDKYE